MELKTETTDLTEFVTDAASPDMVIPDSIYDVEKLAIAHQKYPSVNMGFFKYLIETPDFIDGHRLFLPLFQRTVIFGGDGNFDLVCGFVEVRDTYTDTRKEWQITAKNFGDIVSPIITMAIREKMGIGKSETCIIPVPQRRYQARPTFIIPLPTRQKTDEAKRIFDTISVVTEVQSWDEVVIKTDPVVLGEINGHYYLIDHWDTTGAEDMIISKFTSA